MQSPPEGYSNLGTDNVFCLEDVQIPPNLPSIIKTFVKDAIRTQPNDALQWSAVYFRALARGQRPPVKERLEYPVLTANSGLTKGILRALHQQSRVQEVWRKEEIVNFWTVHCLNPRYLNEHFSIIDPEGQNETVEWKKVLALAAGSLGKTLGDTLQIICEVVTNQPEGTEPYIEFPLWFDLYTYLAQLHESVSEDRIREVYEHLAPLASANGNLIGPRNFLHQNVTLV